MHRHDPVLPCIDRLRQPFRTPHYWLVAASTSLNCKCFGVVDSVLVPKLTDRDDSSLPYWDQHTEAVKQALADVPQERRVVLVGHSGAGPLLPAIHRAIAQSVAACLFVDASL
jgi:hypothetical protein